MQWLRLPNSKYDIRISSSGEIKSFEDNQKTPKIYTNRKGYISSHYQPIKGKNISFRIHRLVGMLFIDIPDRLKHLPLSELQINHIDGDKLNNGVDNLEWVTNAENMKHARDTGLFSNEKTVLVKCQRTGEIVIFKSLNEVSRQKNIKASDLSIHLNQRTAGCVIYNGERFKFDNGTPWCTLDIHPQVEQKFSYQYKLKATNTVTNEVWLFRSLPEACNILSLNMVEIKNNKQFKNVFANADGTWLFDYISGNNLKDKQIPILRLDRITGKIVKYNSSRSCARKNEIDHSKLFKHLTTYFAGMLPWNGFYFKYDDGTSFPEIEYLLPDASVIGRTIRWIVLREDTGKKYPLTTISDFSSYFKIDAIDIYHHFERVGADIPFNGFKFTDISNITIRDALSLLQE